MTDKLSHNGVIAAEDLYYLMGAQGNVRLLDATYSLPNAGISPFDAFMGRHINGAQFFDIDVVADQEAKLPHTLPTPEYFASCMSSLGISNDDHVVIYDQSGAYMASARAWWMLRVFGHENVYVLEGGLDAWIKAGYPVANGPAKPPIPSIYIAGYRPELVVSKNDLLHNIQTGAVRVLDARPPQRFAGNTPEPWAGKRAGHIPKSQNLFHGEMIDASTRKLKDTKTLEDIFSKMGLNADDKLAATCGSGVTACTIALALFKARGQNCAVYDGSWSEWGDEAAGTPVEISA